MRLRVLSDLHLETGSWTYEHIGEDILILAGDVADRSPAGREGQRQLLQAIERARTPTLYVLGNHEGYADMVPMDELRSAIRAELPSQVQLLDRNAVDIGGLRFLGCPLWTDFTCLDGLTRRGIAVSRDLAMHAAGCSITDFVYLCERRGREGKPRHITPEDMAAWHIADRTWLDNAIRQADRPTVVITHFLPSPASLDPRFAGGVLNAYFATDCRDLMRDPVRLWIHGHTHSSCDYRHGDVRVLCNPRGYSGPQRVDNERFRDDLVVDLDVPDSTLRDCKEITFTTQRGAAC